MGRKITVTADLSGIVFKTKNSLIKNMKMESQATKKTENIGDYLSVSPMGIIKAGGKENPTDMEIAASVRAFAAAYSKDAKAVKNNDIFELRRASPMISHQKGHKMTKKEWMDDRGWTDEQFETYHSSGILKKA